MTWYLQRFLNYIKSLCVKMTRYWQRFLNYIKCQNVPILSNCIHYPTGTHRRGFDVDITSIHQRPNFDEFPRRVRVFFDVISMVEKSPLFPCTFLNVICLVEICTFFYLLFLTQFWWAKIRHRFWLVVS